MGGLTTGKVGALVRMPTRLATTPPPCREPEAIAGIASHLRTCRTPKMIREIVAFADQAHSGLNAIAARAVKQLERNAPAAKANVAAS